MLMAHTTVTVKILLIVLGLLCAHVCSEYSGIEPNIGQCYNESDNCSTCYQALVKSLMSKDPNLFSLSKSFFPTNSNDRPQFVTVTYQFKGTNETKVWYWSEKGSYFIYPLQTFEYLSLFFGKAAVFFTGSVTVTLDEECRPTSDDFMQHLTQRIKLYVAKKSITPEIDDSYIATAHNKESWSKQLKVHHNQIVKIIYFTPTLAAAIFTVMVLIFAGTTSWFRDLAQRSESHSQPDDIKSSSSRPHSDLISCNAKPIVVAISIVSHIFIVFTLALSVFASFEVKYQPADFKSISDPLSNISIMVAAVDGILLLVCFVTDAVAFCVAVSSSCPFDCAFIVLSCNGFYALLSILLHTPYIILAYINDASLTGSMSIFYVITVSSQLLAVGRFFMVYQEYNIYLRHKRFCLKFCNKQQSEANYDRLVFSPRDSQSRLGRSRQQSQSGRIRGQLISSTRALLEEEDQTEKTPLLATTKGVQKCDIICSSLLFIVYSIIFCALVMGVAALLTCYLVILPITNGFSNLFNRLFITFHIAILIVGALIYMAYKIFIEKRSDSPDSKKEEEQSIELKEKDNIRGTRNRSRSRKTQHKQKEHDSAC